MGTLKWLDRLDRNLWMVPILVFLAIGVGLAVWSALSRTPVLLAAPVTARDEVYSSLTGSSSALLGLAVAIVAILVAFAPKPNPAETQLAQARAILIGSLLVASFFLLVILVDATVALAVDSKHIGNWALTTILEASGAASVIGLLVGGFGLALVIVERSRP